MMNDPHVSFMKNTYSRNNQTTSARPLFGRDGAHSVHYLFILIHCIFNHVIKWHSICDIHGACFCSARVAQFVPVIDLKDVHPKLRSGRRGWIERKNERKKDEFSRPLCLYIYCFVHPEAIIL